MRPDLLVKTPGELRSHYAAHVVGGAHVVAGAQAVAGAHVRMR